MPDWSAYVRQRLHLRALREEREAEIVEDLARQLDDAYRDALMAGATDAEAQRAAGQHITNWDALSHQLSTSPRQRHAAIDRWQQQVDDRMLETGGQFTFSSLRLEAVSRVCVDGRGRSLCQLVRILPGRGGRRYSGIR